MDLILAALAVTTALIAWSVVVAEHPTDHVGPFAGQLVRGLVGSAAGAVTGSAVGVAALAVVLVAALAVVLAVATVGVADDSMAGLKSEA